MYIVKIILFIISMIYLLMAITKDNLEDAYDNLFTSFILFIIAMFMQEI